MNPFDQCLDEVLRGSLPALKRAARRAHALVSDVNAGTVSSTEKASDSMSTEELIASALKLSPVERFALVDEILHSLDRPDPEVDRLWIEEAERRLAAFRSGAVQGIPAQDVVGDL
jgi:putative addiction module component (TIGR02574 family)